MGALLEIIFRSKSLTQKKSTNGLHKRLRLSTKYALQRSLTLEGILITDSHKLRLYKLRPASKLDKNLHKQPQGIKHLKFLKLPYLNLCL